LFFQSKKTRSEVYKQAKNSYTVSHSVSILTLIFWKVDGILAFELTEDEHIHMYSSPNLILKLISISY